MKPNVTTGIVLTRVNFGEADRIITFLTPDHGKVTAIAKGVRKSKSKLAGGIELFSVSDISFIIGRGEIATLISTRLKKHYAKIVKDIDRTQAGYEFIKLTHKATEEQPEPEYFHLLQLSFETLEEPELDLNLIKLWFDMQLLRLAGHSPNLHTDVQGNKLSKEHSYDFEFDGMKFKPVNRNGGGAFRASDIQFLRLGFSNNSPKALARIKGINEFVSSAQPLVRTMLQNFVRV